MDEERFINFLQIISVIDRPVVTCLNCGCLVQENFKDTPNKFHATLNLALERLNNFTTFSKLN